MSASLQMTSINPETDDRPFERPGLTYTYNIEHVHIFHRTLVAPEIIPRMSKWNFMELNTY